MTTHGFRCFHWSSRNPPTTGGVVSNDKQRNGTWVDLERGTISREIFVNEDIYRSELEQIFARTWLLVGHESQIPEPGDFFLSRMGEESVIVTRDPQHRNPRAAEHLPAPGHEGLPLRSGQHIGVHLPLSRLELLHGRRPGGDAGRPLRRSPIPCGLPRTTGQIGVGPDPRGADGSLQGNHLGHLGRVRAVVLPNTSAACVCISMRCWTRVTAAREARRCWAGWSSGVCRATGSSPPRTSPGTPTTAPPHTNPRRSPGWDPAAKDRSATARSTANRPNGSPADCWRSPRSATLPSPGRRRWGPRLCSPNFPTTRWWRNTSRKWRPNGGSGSRERSR